MTIERVSMLRIAAACGLLDRPVSEVENMTVEAAIAARVARRDRVRREREEAAS